MQFTQDTLFPESAVQTTGWAQPDTDNTEQADDEQAEAA
jgi:hypothetical protein